MASIERCLPRKKPSQASYRWRIDDQRRCRRRAARSAALRYAIPINQVRTRCFSEISWDNYMLFVSGLTQMEGIYSFLWSFLPAKLAKKDHRKEIFRSAEGEKRCLRRF